ncbi:MAG: SMP-30/gluconolactonase/LRE family protein [Acidobacteria bacterium]|nr:SMP-30/gluconolactonase/LRE family protein [Acidobacteriota bacterium]
MQIGNINLKAVVLLLLNLCLLVLLSASMAAQSGTIATYAGSEPMTGGQPASSQLIEVPTAIAPDGEGGFYVVSLSQSRVYHVAADGALRLFAGSSFGAGGSGGPATAAQLAIPKGIAVDPAGNVYIADSFNNRICKVDSGGVLTTVAGVGATGYSGDGGPATGALLAIPRGVAVDSLGDLYIADTFNNRIRRVTPGGVIDTIAGDGSPSFSGDGNLAVLAQLNSPQGLVLDSAGNLYIADTGNHRIRRITTDGVISTIAGNGTGGFGGDGGQATAAQLDTPIDVAVDDSGNVYIADSNNNRIRKMASDGSITTLAGTGLPGFSGDGGPATAARLNDPYGVAVDASGSIYIADTFNNSVRVISADLVIRTAAGNGAGGIDGDGGPAVLAQFGIPQGIAVDSGGNLYIADSLKHRIRKVSRGGVITTVAGTGKAGFNGDSIPATAAEVNSPQAVAIDGAGTLYVADTLNHRIRKIATDGVISTVAGVGVAGFGGDGGAATSAQMNTPQGIAVTAAGVLYIADTFNYRVRRVTGATISTVAGVGTAGFEGDGGAATSSRLLSPTSLAIDAGGNVYIADTLNNRIRRVNDRGVISTVAGDGAAGFGGDGGTASAAQLAFPRGVAVDASGNLYVADTFNNRVRKVTSAGTISTVAGDGTASFGGDGEAATSAQLAYPLAVAVDPAGNLYIADTFNRRIRQVTGGGR